MINYINVNHLVQLYDAEAWGKVFSADRFTESISNPGELINSNKFYLRILLATVGIIGADLDSADFYGVCRLSFPTSVFAMAQELGRCGGDRLNECTMISDNFHLYLTLDDFFIWVKGYIFLFSLLQVI